MKRLIPIVVILNCIAPLSAQISDARVSGVGHAFTAVADDQNAIYLNPAGLVYLEIPLYFVDATIDLDFTKRLVPYSNTYRFPDVIRQEIGEDEIAYAVRDYFLNVEIPFDPSEYGFPYDHTISGDYERAVEEYLEFHSLYYLYHALVRVSESIVTPRIGYLGRSFGIGGFSRNRIEFDEPEYDGPDTPIGFNVVRQNGAIAGFGIPFGAFSLGVNFKIMLASQGRFEITLSDFSTEQAQRLIIEPTDSSYLDFELGLGGLFAVNRFALGAYVDNVLAFLDFSGEANHIDPAGVLDAFAIGGSYDFVESRRSPGDRRIEYGRLGVDLRHLGNPFERELSAGIEFGIDLRLFGFGGRLGYRQLLLGTFLEALRHGINPQFGNYIIGIRMNALFLNLDISVDIPASIAYDFPAPINSYRAYVRSELDTYFGNARVTLSISY